MWMMLCYGNDTWDFEKMNIRKLIIFINRYEYVEAVIKGKEFWNLLLEVLLLPIVSSSSTN